MIRPATSEDIAAVRNLFREYADSLSVDLCFQNFEQEVKDLPGDYDPILVSSEPDSTLSACIALRPLKEGVAEMKRLYVRPQHRGKRLGRQLVEAIMQAAIDRNFESIRLDTLPEMQNAIALYRRMGFQEIAPYRDNPVPGALFLELKLATPGRVLGIGGIFFKSPNHESLRTWYHEKLGIQNEARFHNTVWSIFPGDTDYFNPSPASFMINYIVDNLDAFLAKCKTRGVAIDPKREDSDYGRFAWIYDPNGNKIELWQPLSSASNS